MTTLTLTKTYTEFVVIDFDFIDLDYRYYISLDDMTGEDRLLVQDLIGEVLKYKSFGRLSIETYKNVNLTIYHSEFNYFNNTEELSVDIIGIGDFLELCLKSKI